MRKIGSRELKNRLGRYLDAVRRGESLLVTDRGKLVAKISPANENAQDDRTVEEILKQSEAQGLIRRARRPMSRSRAVKIKGVPASRTILEDRR